MVGTSHKVTELRGDGKGMVTGKSGWEWKFGLMYM